MLSYGFLAFFTLIILVYMINSDVGKIKKNSGKILEKIKSIEDKINKM